MKLFTFFVFRSLVIFIVTFVACSLLRVHFFASYKKKSNGKREFILSLTVAYLAVLAFLLFTPNAVIANHGIDLSSQHFDFMGNFRDRIHSGVWGVNLVPFKTMRAYLKYSGFFHVLLNLLGNMLLFMPLGLFLPLLYQRAQRALTLWNYALGISLFIEGVQFFVGRSVDIDDIILNSIGGLLGYWIFYRHRDKWKKVAI